MKIRITEDIGAPLAVTVVDLAITATRPDWNEWASYITTVLGYGGATFNFGGDFVKNVGIASLPWAAKNIYNRVRGISGVSRRLNTRVSRWPAPLEERPFKARLV